MGAINFKNRHEAGQLAAFKLLALKIHKPAVFALPRGGIPVGYEIAKALNAPLDTIIVQKISPPQDPSIIIGAVSLGDVVIIDNFAQESFDITDQELAEYILAEKKEMHVTERLYKSGHYVRAINPHTAIITDDGHAGDASIKASIESVRTLYKPQHVIFVSPLCDKDKLKIIDEYADKAVCLSDPDELIAVNLWYDENEDLSDRRLMSLVESLSG